MYGVEFYGFDVRVLRLLKFQLNELGIFQIRCFLGVYGVCLEFGNLWTTFVVKYRVCGIPRTYSCISFTLGKIVQPCRGI